MMALIARLRHTPSPPSVPAPPFPSSPPYNAPSFLQIPSPMGAYSAVHPSVVDMGPGRRWRGYRYWMAFTPYDNTDDDNENPCVVASHDGWTWVVPAGLTNPIYPAPLNGLLFNSDTDLVYDPDTDEMILVYRAQERDPYKSQRWFYARTYDGVTYPPVATRFDLPRPDRVQFGPGQLLSPSMVRVASGAWRAFTIYRDVTPMQLQVWEAPSVEAAWYKVADLTGFEALLEAGMNPWHLDVIHDGSAYRMLLDLGPNYLAKPDGLVAASSLDGVSWNVNITPVMMPSPSGWDSVELYRSTLAPHENGTHFRVWYSAQGTVGAIWHTGYTEIPRSLWPDPPA